MHQDMSLEHIKQVVKDLPLKARNRFSAHKSRAVRDYGLDDNAAIIHAAVKMGLLDITEKQRGSFRALKSKHIKKGISACQATEMAWRSIQKNIQINTQLEVVTVEQYKLLEEKYLDLKASYERLAVKFAEFISSKDIEGSAFAVTTQTHR